jgi:hypothetical protein
MMKTLALTVLALCLAGASTLAYADDSCAVQAFKQRIKN